MDTELPANLEFSHDWLMVTRDDEGTISIDGTEDEDVRLVLAMHAVHFLTCGFCSEDIEEMEDDE